jgi:hypothetical protein
MFRKHFDHVWKARERLDRWIPRLGIHLRKVASRHGFRVAGDPALRLDNLIIEGARRQDQRQQGIRVERNRTQQIFELRERVKVGSRLRSLGIGCLGWFRLHRVARRGLREHGENGGRPYQQHRHGKPRPFSDQERRFIAHRSHRDLPLKAAGSSP